MTLTYKGLHKIALSNWYPTKHVTTLSRDFATLLFDIGTGTLVHLGKIIFDFIALHRCGNNMSHKLPFPALIFGLLESQKLLQEPNEFLSAPVQPYVFRIKEKGVSSEGEQSADVTTEPSVATEILGTTTSAISSFFKAELRAIKEKQGS